MLGTKKENFGKQVELECQLMSEDLERKEEEENRKKRNEDFCNQLDEESRNNVIVCVETYSEDLKQLALNHMFKKGWRCVQNDVSCTQATVHYVLTFTSYEGVAFFVAK